MPKIIVERQRDQAKEESLRVKGVHPLLARLLASRGIEGSDLDRAGLKDLIPANSLKDIDLAAEIMCDALINKKRIHGIADFDSDGANSCAIAMLGLRMFHKALGHSGEEALELVKFTVPDRMRHGYGTSPLLVEEIVEKDSPDLILTMDNGISSIAGIARAKELGVGVVVTDHHLQGDELPDALAIVNPNRKDCSFPSKALCGAGVVFYLLMHMRAKMRGVYFTAERQPALVNLLDFLAIATIGDVVALDENNRRIVHAGLQRIRADQMNPGVRALFSVAGKDHKQASTTDIAFGVVPRINAAGRLADMTLGIQTLIAQDYAVALHLATQLDEMNEERKRIELEMREEAFADEGLQAVLSTPWGEESAAGIVVEGDHFHAGVIGILASRIKDATYRPVVVLAKDEDGEHYRGSGRSIPGVHLRDVMEWCVKQLPNSDLVRFGGHAGAAGIHLCKEHVEPFKVLFDQGVRLFADEGSFDEKLITDGPIPAECLNVDVAHLLRSQVWGQAFPEPLFVDRFEVVDRRILKEKHTKLTVMKDGQEFTALKWNYTDEVPEFIEAVFKLQTNEFRGNVSVQLMLEDIV